MKKFKIILCTLVLSLIFIGNVSADSCTDCANSGTPCGRCGYSCAINDKGICVTNTNFGGSEQKNQKNQDMGGCSGYTYEYSCNYNEHYACIWNDNKYGTYCNTDQLVYIRCGDIFDIPVQAPETFSLCVNLLKIGTPIILIIVSIIALLKSLAASSEDEIKKAQKGLIRKLIAAVMVFFVISIVQFVTLKVADTDNSRGASEADNLSTCLTCFLNNDCGSNVYYKTSVLGEYECTYFTDLNHPKKCN